MAGLGSDWEPFICWKNGCDNRSIFTFLVVGVIATELSDCILSCWLPVAERSVMLSIHSATHGKLGTCISRWVVRELWNWILHTNLESIQVNDVFFFENLQPYYNQFVDQQLSSSFWRIPLKIDLHKYISFRSWQVSEVGWTNLKFLLDFNITLFPKSI